MSEDPKLLFVRMAARLSRETQLHLDHRHYHFRINKVVVITISVLLIILAAVNIYYVRILYVDLNGIVNNMDSMHNNMQRVTVKMLDITKNVKQFERDMVHMDSITAHTRNMAELMPPIATSMNKMAGDITTINPEMRHMSNGMTNIDQRFNHMAQGVHVMRQNVREVSRPMGAMNPFMP